jgi:uncharacterized glyoxalase superfamily protein PhnB
MITGPRFVSLYCTNQDQAIEFWSKKVGFDVQLDVPYEEGSSVRWIEVKPPRGDTYIVLSLPQGGQEQLIGKFSNVWFACDDLDATFDDLKAKGVDFPVPPSVADWDPEQRWAQFADPDGNLYGLSPRS